MSGKPNILIVDDETNIKIVKHHLSKENYNLAAANGGAQAWEILKRQPDFFDVVLLNQVMSEMDGIGILSRIKSDKVLANIPVIVQTTSFHVGAILKAGAYYYYFKPINFDDLKSVITNAILDRQIFRKLRNRPNQNDSNIEISSGKGFKLRSIDQAYDLAVQLANLCPSPEHAVTGLAELLFNAIEHGNLGISYDEKTKLTEQECLQNEIEHRLSLPKYKNRFVEVNFSKTHDEIRFTVKDQGAGFAWQEYLHATRERAFDNHGRGIALAKHTSFDQLIYHGVGNHVEAVITLNQSADGLAPATKSNNVCSAAK